MTKKQDKRKVVVFRLFIRRKNGGLAFLGEYQNERDVVIAKNWYVPDDDFLDFEVERKWKIV